MSTVNNAFLDVDFTRDPRYIKGYDSFGDATLFGNYEDSVEMIPSGEWDDRIAEIDKLNNGADSLVTRIYDQMREGSCVANQTAQMHEVLQALQFGKDRVTHLSAISLYKRIGSSPNSGASVSEGMKVARDEGILPLDNPENAARYGSLVMPNTGFYTRFPAGDWKTIALQFRFDEVDVINTLEGMMTALLRRQPVGVGRQGHSILYCRPMGTKSKGYKSKYVNSWGNWGDGGFGYDTLSQMRISAGWAYTVRSVIRPDWLN